jgi:uncharacterized protein
MSMLFVDTWGWLSLHDRRGTQRQRVAALYMEARAQDWDPFTTDNVLDETFTLLFKRLPFVQAEHALQILRTAWRDGYLRLERITPERFERALALRLRLQDKPAISFTDLTSMCVMDELQISAVLTGDAHFSHAGLGFQVLP